MKGDKTNSHIRQHSILFVGMPTDLLISSIRLLLRLHPGLNTRFQYVQRQCARAQHFIMESL